MIAQRTCGAICLDWRRTQGLQEGDICHSLLSTKKMKPFGYRAIKLLALCESLGVELILDTQNCNGKTRQLLTIGKKYTRKEIEPRYIMWLANEKHVHRRYQVNS